MPTALIRAPRIFRSSDSRVAAVLYRYVLSYNLLRLNTTLQLLSVSSSMELHGLRA